MEYDLIPPEATVNVSFDGKVTGTCDVCKRIKSISSWVTIKMNQECGEYQEFIGNFGKDTIKVCFNCYIRPILLQIGPE